MSLLIVGSIALDTVETGVAKVENAIGGSAIYGSYAASCFTRPHIVGVVGDDFPKKEIESLKKRDIDVSGLQVVKGGKTFRWGGRYFDDMNQRETLFTELNVFAEFAPVLPEPYRRIKDVFLANIDPELQLDVLSQVQNPRLVVCDTMNLWINIKLPVLKQLLKKIHAILINDEEARMLADTLSLPKAAERILKMGVERVIIKKGEHGCLMFGPDGAFAAPGLPLRVVKDPTGAGDTFAGGLMGWIAGKPLTPVNWRKAIIAGTALASFCVEDFSVRGLRKMESEKVKQRAEMVRQMMIVGKV